jgi:hypothetical protein
MHILACKRHPIAKLTKMLAIPVRYFEALEHNQQISSCCRHPENHELEAWYSCEDQRDKGVPDIYKFHCTCGKAHTRFCVGGDHVDAQKYSRFERPELYDNRPFWDIR